MLKHSGTQFSTRDINCSNYIMLGKGNVTINL